MLRARSWWYSHTLTRANSHFVKSVVQSIMQGTVSIFFFHRPKIATFSIVAHAMTRSYLHRESTIKLTTTSIALTRQYHSPSLKLRNGTSSALSEITCVWICAAGVWFLSSFEIEHPMLRTWASRVMVQAWSHAHRGSSMARAHFVRGYAWNHARNAPGQSC